MNRTTKITLTVVLIGAVIAAAYIKLRQNKSELEAKVYHPDVNTAVMVQTETAKQDKFDQTLSFTGSFMPNREVVIGSEASGKVIRVGVQQGSQVSAGHLIAQLDKGVLEAQLLSAQASYSRAVSTLSRYEQAASGVTLLQMDNAKTEVLTSQAQIKQLKEQLAQLTIRAPFAGIITARNFDLGAIVSPGLQMATLSDISFLKLNINVPEKNVASFATGKSIKVSTDVFPAVTFPGTVNMVAAKADASHNFLIEILVRNPKQQLKSGMYGTVSMNDDQSDAALTIPRSALTGSSLKPQVYVVVNGIARLRDIRLGSGNESRIEVTSGLKEKEIVVTGGLVNLRDGIKVNIAR